MKEVIVSPSLLGGNPLNIEKDVEMINNSEADWLHIDIMDGVFVPNIAIGFPVLQGLGKICRKPLDVHLMIVHPEKWIDLIASTGAMMMNVHYEACTHLHRVVQQIHQAGMKAAVTLNPATPVSMLEDIINDVDMVLLMSVNPGFGGQKFMPNRLQMVQKGDEMRKQFGYSYLIEVDGGVCEDNVATIKDACADIVVAGSAVFKSENPTLTIERLHA